MTVHHNNVMHIIRGEKLMKRFFILISAVAVISWCWQPVGRKNRW